MPRSPIRRTLGPTQVMAFVLVMMIIVPTAYIALSDYYTTRWLIHSEAHYRDAAQLALFVSVLFAACMFVGYASFWIAPRKAPRFRQASYSPISSEQPKAYLIRHNESFFLIRRGRHVYWVGLVSALSMWMIFATGGYGKIAQFGEEISQLEYRLIGANDSRIVTVLIQIARRLILPFCIIYLTVLRLYGAKVSLKYLMFLNVSLFIGVVITLDRAPLMLMVIMYFYISYIKAKSLTKLGLITASMLSSVVMLGGVTTFIQHNIQDFALDDVVLTGLNFISNRAVMAPNFVPIELSYGLFDFSSDKLNLEHARLLSLFTGNYVGTREDASLYVGPVGAIADIWRNLGVFGIILFGFAIGIFFAYLDVAVRALEPVACAAVTFTVISLTFYFYYGTFFSQGVFLQIFFLLAAVRFFRRDALRYLE